MVTVFLVSSVWYKFYCSLVTSIPLRGNIHYGKFILYSVTGKLWPKLYEIKLHPLKTPFNGDIKQMCMPPAFPFSWSLQWIFLFQILDYSVSASIFGSSWRERERERATCRFWECTEYTDFSICTSPEKKQIVDTQLNYYLV